MWRHNFAHKSVSLEKSRMWTLANNASGYVVDSLSGSDAILSPVFQSFNFEMWLIYRKIDTLNEVQR